MIVEAPTDVNVQEKQISLSDGTKLAYQKLLINNGCKDCDHTFKTLERGALALKDIAPQYFTDWISYKFKVNSLNLGNRILKVDQDVYIARSGSDAMPEWAAESGRIAGRQMCGLYEDIGPNLFGLLVDNDLKLYGIGSLDKDLRTVGIWQNRFDRGAMLYFKDKKLVGIMLVNKPIECAFKLLDSKDDAIEGIAKSLIKNV